MRTSTRLAPLVSLATAAAVLLTGCSGGDRGTPDAVRAPGGDRSLLTDYGAEVPEGSGRGGADDASGASSSDGLAAGAPAAAPRALASGSSSKVGEAPVTGDLRAGFVDDNANWEDYLAYRARYDKGGLPSDDLDVTGRRVVTVRGGDGKPLLGATVLLRDGDEVTQRVRTHADGRALLHPAVAGSGDTVEVRFGEEASVKPLSDSDLAFSMKASRPEGRVRLDLHFLLDTTGSMGDEIERLRTTLDDVARRIDALPQEPEVRYGLTVYKDREDAYVSRTHDFTDLATFREELARTSAGGGGDTPEALDEAFHGAVKGPAWDSSRAVQIAFLVADAPPHLGSEQGDAPSYAKALLVAAEKGIEVVPLASSGSDDTAEYVFRQLAQYTLGTFFFLTYGADGRSPGDTTKHDVTGFETGSLDDLVVGHVSARLAALEGRGRDQ